MSQGCNFINSWMSANRKRSASATPQQTTAKQSSHEPEQGTGTSRRASSSDELVLPANPLKDRSLSGNHLTAGASNETICDANSKRWLSWFKSDSDCKAATATTDKGMMKYGQSSLSDLSPLQIDIDCAQDCNDDDDSRILNCINLDSSSDSDNIIHNSNGLKDSDLEDECKNLRDEVEFWEKEVEELERKHICEDVPRSLVEKVLNQRRKLRELTNQIYRLNLESEESDWTSQNHSFSSSGCCSP